MIFHRSSYKKKNNSWKKIPCKQLIKSLIDRSNISTVINHHTIEKFFRSILISSIRSILVMLQNFYDRWVTSFKTNKFYGSRLIISKQILPKSEFILRHIFNNPTFLLESWIILFSNSFLSRMLTTYLLWIRI